MAKAETKEEVVTTQEAPERKIEQLNPARMKEAEYERTHWVATAHANTLPEDLLSPDYWSHCAAKFKPWDKIEARADDGTWYAEYLVLEAGRNWARTTLLTKHNLTTADVALSQAAQGAYEIKYRGPHSKWSVIRRGDNEVMHEGEQTQGGAINWMNERLKAGV